jgi:hypothetical protein
MLQKLTIYNDKLVTDIIKKIYFSDNFVKSNLVDNYFIKDDDTLESLSIALYNNIQYSYFNFILNNYQNKFKDYPIEQSVLNEYIEEKYSNTSIVLKTDINLSNIKFVGNTTSKYKVLSYDKSFWKLTIERTTTLPSTLQLYDENEILLGSTSIYNPSYDDSFGLHHFEKSGEIQDPYSTPFVSQNSYIEGYANGNLEEYVITNYNYELQKNDEKRNALLVRPEFISLIEKQYNKLVKGINKNINILDIPSSTTSSMVE